jgi:hypothetical protein
MNRLPNWIVVVAQLGLAGAWLMSGGVYVATPKAMERLLGMPDGVRIALGVAMVVVAVLVVAGAFVRKAAALSNTALWAATIAAVLWVAYDLTRGWEMFAAFHGGLAVLAAALVWIRARTR